ATEFDAIGRATSPEVEDAVEGLLKLDRLASRDPRVQDGLAEAPSVAEGGADQPVALDLVGDDLFEGDLAPGGRGRALLALGLVERRLFELGVDIKERALYFIFIRAAAEEE